MTSEKNKKPSLIVFDLDYTLWPFWVDTHVTPPFMKKADGNVVDATGEKVLLYPQSTEILKNLYESGYKLGVASRTGEIDGARQLIELFGWKQYFSFVEIFPGQKTTHFKNIKSASKIDFRDMLFFDDEQRNIRDVEKIGVVSILVEDGVTRDVIQAGLKKYAER